MGDYQHSALFVSESVTRVRLDRAHARAHEVFGESRVTPLMAHPINGGGSFFVAPCGSKKGWASDKEFDLQRNAFIEYLHDEIGLDWIEVSYGDLYDEVERTSEGLQAEVTHHHKDDCLDKDNSPQ